MRIAHSLLACGLAVLVAACAPATSALAGDSDSAQTSSNQKIMLDPDTGDITQVPSQRAEKQSKSAAGANQKAQKNSGYTAWTTKDGTQMIATDPSTSAKERVVRCPDGSLRMGKAGGTADHASDSDTPAALCNDQQ